MYHVIHKESGKVTTLACQDINDLFEDANGRIIACGTDMEIYWLLVDSDIIQD